MWWLVLIVVFIGSVSQVQAEECFGEGTVPVVGDWSEWMYSDDVETSVRRLYGDPSRGEWVQWRWEGGAADGLRNWVFYEDNYIYSGGFDYLFYSPVYDRMMLGEMRYEPRVVMDRLEVICDGWTEVIEVDFVWAEDSGYVETGSVVFGTEAIGWEWVTIPLGTFWTMKFELTEHWTNDRAGNVAWAGTYRNASWVAAGLGKVRGINMQTGAESILVATSREYLPEPDARVLELLALISLLLMRRQRRESRA